MAICAQNFTIGVKTIEGTIIKGSDRSQNIVRVSDNKLSFGKIIENTQIMRKADDGAYSCHTNILRSELDQRSKLLYRSGWIHKRRFRYKNWTGALLCR